MNALQAAAFGGMQADRGVLVRPALRPAALCPLRSALYRLLLHSTLLHPALRWSESGWLPPMSLSLSAADGVSRPGLLREQQVASRSTAVRQATVASTLLRSALCPLLCSALCSALGSPRPPGWRARIIPSEMAGVR